jgi:DNA-binding response OmpR family regulator
MVKKEGHLVARKALLEYIWAHEFGDKRNVLEAYFASLRDTMHTYPVIRDLLEEEPTEDYSFARGVATPRKLQEAKRR